MHRLHIFSGMQRRVSVVKDIPVVNRFQGVVSFFCCWCVSGHIDLRQRGKAKGDPLLFLFSFCIPLVISPTSSSLVSTSRVLPGRKKKESVCSHQLLTSLLFKRLVRALSNQSPAELDFHLSTPAFISTSLIHYSTIFLEVHHLFVL